MVNKKVEFYLNSIRVEGIIRDKVNVPLASGTNEYVPMDSYLIVDNDGDFHVVNPINILKELKNDLVEADETA